MGFLGQNFDNVVEPKSVEPGEYQLRVLAAEIKESEKTGGPFIQLRCEILDSPAGAATKDVTHVMMLPAPADDAKKRNQRLFNVQNFLKACDKAPDQVENVEELIGDTFWAILTEEEDKEYGTSNRVRKVIAPK